jgi:hypothetical protein
VTAVERALKDFLAACPQDVEIALVGGIAVSARTEPRFTRDLDFAVAVVGDDEASQYVFRLRGAGYEIATSLEHTTHDRLATVRLRRGQRGPVIDLLFAMTGIESEIVRAAEPIQIGAAIVAKVAQVGHLIALKLVSRDDKRRPQDRGDLAALAKVATETEWLRAEQAVRLIEQRGFARKRDLQAALVAWKAAANEP